MRGRDLHAALYQLATRHRVSFRIPDVLPLAPLASGPQWLSGFASTPLVDAERTTFPKGALTWPEDLRKLPLLVRHNTDRIAGQILDLHYDEQGCLCIVARVDDPEAARFGGFSIAATITASSLHSEDSSCFYATVEQARLEHIALTDRPACADARVTFRRPVTAADVAHDAALAATMRAREALEALQRAWPTPTKGVHVQLCKSDASANEAHAHHFEAVPPQTDIAATTPLILSDIPAAILKRRQTDFSRLVCGIEARNSVA